MDHDCRNSVTFQFKNKFQAFLRASREISDSLPDSLDGLVAQAGIHVVIAPGDNLKGGVFTPWRVALYVAGDEASVKNARPLAATHRTSLPIAGGIGVSAHNDQNGQYTCI